MPAPALNRAQAARQLREELAEDLDDLGGPSAFAESCALLSRETVEKWALSEAPALIEMMRLAPAARRKKLARLPIHEHRLQLLGLYWWAQLAAQLEATNVGERIVPTGRPRENAFAWAILAASLLNAVPAFWPFGGPDPFQN